MAIKTSVDEMQHIFAKVGKQRGVDVPQLQQNSWIDEIDQNEAMEIVEEEQRKSRNKRLLMALIFGSIILLLSIKLTEIGAKMFKDTQLISNLEDILQDSLQKTLTPTIAGTVAQEQDDKGGDGFFGGAKKKKETVEEDENYELLEAGNTPLDERNELESEVGTILKENIRGKVQQLSAREQQLKSLEAMLSVTQDKLQQRQDSLDTTRDEIKGLLDEYKNAKDAEKGRLVGIFSSMDPKKAALIFNDLGTDIIVEVVAQMTPRKSAQILAAMAPGKAKQVTEVLSGRKAEPVAGAGNNSSNALNSSLDSLLGQ